MEAEKFQSFFQKVTGANAPHDWQTVIGSSPDICNRLIRIPTGFGKTLGVLAAWTYNRVVRRDEVWPRRLVWCLPMRALVEQTAAVIHQVVAPLGVQVHTVMGGEDIDDWFLYPETNAVLVGTQDMLLSRALNRGYAAPRARWPMEFGLLNCDCLWIMDEVQLMDVGLATSAQLQQFREEDRPKTFRPSYTWWMSATLQPEWLKSVDTRALVEKIESDALCMPDADKQGGLWQSATKTLKLVEAMDEKSLAKFVAERHAATEALAGRMTLVIVNTVKRAVAVFEALKKAKTTTKKIELVHSRFRPYERAQWRAKFLNRAAGSGADRIIVATQVVEAGVDISATCLITDLAPWPSLVQRFGRAARYGGRAEVHVIDIGEEKKALPYAYADLEAARSAVQQLDDVAIPHLELFEAELTREGRHTLYPYEPPFLLLRKELDELFDTTPDLTGADLDISRFIRSGDERDAQVFWAIIERGTTPSPKVQAAPDELCPVPIGDLRAFFEKAPKDNGTLFWKWDYLDGAWNRATPRDLYPGQIYLIRTDAGGYSSEKGFDPSSRQPVAVVPRKAEPLAMTEADLGQDNESLSVVSTWQTIAEHGASVAHLLDNIVSGVGDIPEHYAALLIHAAHWHDLGKAHPAFVSLLKPDVGHPAGEIAKAPPSAWRGGRPAYQILTENGVDARPGFRHELASALALLDLLRQANPLHEALLGPWQELLAPIELMPASAVSTPLHQALDAMTAESFNLLLYLVAAHHGKVRTGFHATPSDQEHPVARVGEGMPIRGVMEGDTIPPLTLTAPDGRTVIIPATTLSLEPAAIGLSPHTGMSWTERCATLLQQHGPFTLAWLEALLRAADCRASKDLA